MAELIDIGLVAAVVGIALWAVVKYFIDLGRAPTNGQPVSCSGCDISCHQPISPPKL